MNSTKKIKIETPVGSIESDSGSHIVDVITVVTIVMLILHFKRKWRK